MTDCPKCKLRYFKVPKTCLGCGYELRCETATTREETLRSSDVVTELAAELRLQWKALNTAAQARDRNAHHAAFTRIVDIESALATEPRRSATKQHQRPATEDVQNG